MALFFVDTSALSKRYVEEAGSAWVRSTLQPSSGNAAFILSLTAVELTSAIVRRERGGSITPADSEMARFAFQHHVATEYLEVEVTSGLIQAAIQLGEHHALRATDALQMAGATQVARLAFENGLSLTLLSSDAELSAAARAAGLTVKDPLEHQ